jgi:hypothetical protein
MKRQIVNMVCYISAFHRPVASPAADRLGAYTHLGKLPFRPCRPLSGLLPPAVSRVFVLGGGESPHLGSDAPRGARSAGAQPIGGVVVGELLFHGIPFEGLAGPIGDVGQVA